MSGDVQTIDASALKTNQFFIIVLTLTGFVFDQPIIPAGVAAVMVLGSLWSGFALFKQIYQHVLKPLRLVKPEPAPGPAAPHEFAQLFGGVVLGAGAILLFSGSAVGGWALAWIVIALAATNLFLRFCAGCFVYYQLGKLGVPGFVPKPE